MNIIALLIIVPMLTGVCLLAIRSDRLRRCLVIAVTALLVAASIALAIKLAPNDLTALKFDPQVIGHVMEALEVAMAGFVIYIGLRRGRPLIAIWPNAPRAPPPSPS